MTHAQPDPETSTESRINTAIKTVGMILALLVTIVPAAWASRLGKVKEGIVAAAGSALSVVSALQLMPGIDGTASVVIAYVGIVATAIVTHWTAKR